MTRMQRPKKPFLWCPHCGIHNYWILRGDRLECEDCRYVLPVSALARKSARAPKTAQWIAQKA